MSLDRTTVRNIAFLARIEVPDSDLDGVAKQLSSILQWVEQLREVDTKDVEPMTSVADMTLRWREEDAVTDGGQADKVVLNAPDRFETFFAVPKVVE